MNAITQPTKPYFRTESTPLETTLLANKAHDYWFGESDSRTLEPRFASRPLAKLQRGAKLLKSMPFLPHGYGDTCRDPWIERVASASHSRLLDIGCGMGVTASTAVRRGICSEAHGVEIDPVAAEVARQTLTSVTCADIETTELPFPDDHFDLVFLSEVLEHLRQPSLALREVFRVSEPGATILAGTPNIASLKIIRSLLKGRFDYTDTGVMDRTHVYWFTPATLREAFEEAGFSVKSVDRVNHPGRLQKILAAVTPRRLQYLYWTQVDLLATKPLPPPRRAG